MTTQAYRHKSRNHKPRRCRFKAAKPAMFDCRSCRLLEQGKRGKKQEVRIQKPEVRILKSSARNTQHARRIQVAV